MDDDDYEDLPSLSDLMKDNESGFIDSFFEKIMAKRKSDEFSAVINAAKKAIEYEDILYPF
ncbi:MAG: hypothetical protein IJP18_04285 [Oscillospiraceae bacterium]|nr:hypothetical protein [Oscillospiraceae bacterium]